MIKTFYVHSLANSFYERLPQIDFGCPPRMHVFNSFVGVIFVIFFCRNLSGCQGDYQWSTRSALQGGQCHYPQLSGAAAVGEGYRTDLLVPRRAHDHSLRRRRWSAGCPSEPKGSAPKNPRGCVPE